VEVSDSAVITCSFEGCVQVVNKFNLLIYTPPVVTHINRDNIKVNRSCTESSGLTVMIETLVLEVFVSDTSYAD
jgi:hypothetical protein